MCEERLRSSSQATRSCTPYRIVKVRAALVQDSRDLVPKETLKSGCAPFTSISIGVIVDKSSSFNLGYR
jgi:hypothetical protein